MVTVAPEMLKLFERIQKVGPSDATVLVRGPSGTGKELVAHAIHQESPRRDKPFRAVNCATFTSELLASELFGHVRGSFTGAVRDKAGLLELAHHGTLFLDEAAELPIDLQARLLRVLQERKFTPLGGTEEHEVDIRLVSATNASLRKLVREGRFREDLMYRIRVVVLFLPPLAERTGDVEALTWHWIDRFNARGGRRIHAIGRDAWDAMMAYAWPGNIRELVNNLEQAFVLGDGPTLTLDELAPELQGLDPVDEAPAAREAPAPTEATLDEIVRSEIIGAFRETGGRREEMAERLGISRSTLYRRMKKYGLA